MTATKTVKLTAAQRKAAFKMLVDLQDDTMCDRGSLNLQETFDATAAKYKLTLEQLAEIQDEGILNISPPLDTPAPYQVKRAKSAPQASVQKTAKPEKAAPTTPTNKAAAEMAAKILADQVTVSDTLIEGTVRQVIINAYERNPIARARCIAHYGPSCVVCGFNFGAVYGPFADGFIHVHHVKSLSAIGAEYEVDPIADLRPVCPNCHAVIHLGGKCRGIEEVRRLLRRGTAGNSTGRRKPK